ncbi:MAG TPA: enolase C-terminal domain-like protein [Acidimicrobiales bacterium]|nr:enolase C-terminal domain-like protein [Acidimicrobiales bacterium]
MSGRQVDIRVESVDTRTYSVPTDQKEADGTLTWSKTTVVVTRVSAGGRTGTGWTYGSGACQTVIEETLADVVTGSDPMAVGATNEAMVEQCRNLGRPGVGADAISVLDVALWDLKARLLDTSLTRLLGRHRDRVRIYGSGGFTTYDDARTEEQVAHWIGDLGADAVKIKIGESWGRRAERDLARVRLVRDLVGDEVEVMVDANGGYSRKQAVRAGRSMYDDAGVVWFEEPVSSDDLDGLREVRDQVASDVTAGEYGYHLPYFSHMVDAGAVDCLQVDATRCGGYTGWLQAAALAFGHSLQVSAHCGPNIHAPVAAAVPNLRHVEYFHDHARLDPMLFDGLPAVEKGAMVMDETVAGHGMTLRQADAERYRVR